MVRALSAVVLFLVTVIGGQTVLATSFKTIFGPGGIAGSSPDLGVLNGLDAFTQFSVGEILFFQNGNFYVGGAGPAAGNALSDQGLANLSGPQVNNRNFGVTGSTRTDISFTSSLIEGVILQVRGTAEADGFAVGSRAMGTTFPNDTPLEEAVGTILVFTELGLQAMGSILNADYAPLTLTPEGTFAGRTLSGSSITQIFLINEGPTNSAYTWRIDC